MEGRELRITEGFKVISYLKNSHTKENSSRCRREWMHGKRMRCCFILPKFSSFYTNTRTIMMLYTVYQEYLVLSEKKLTLNMWVEGMKRIDRKV